MTGSIDDKKLRILSINVCGLKTKLLCPEFVTLIKSYDIIGIQESKLDNVERITVEGYQIFVKNRKEYSRYRSGGIALLVKNYLSPFITVFDTNSKVALWFKISRRIAQTEDD